jgi:ADP-heptose:LPS heptosyltransferase
MKVAEHDGKIIALHIDTPALGDTIAAIPTLRKLAQAYEGKIVVFTTKPFLFENHPLVEVAHPASDEKELADPRYKIYRTFMPLMGKQHNIDEQPIEFRYSNMDFRQFHAVSLGFTLKESEMEMDLYIERPRKFKFDDYVIIHPTQTWATRTWDREKWQELTNMLNDKGIPVVAVGRDSQEVGHFNTDKPVMDIDIKYGANILNDNNNDIHELRWMMNNQAKVVVTMDSGILHVAGTTDVNIIQLGSSIDNKLRAPYRQGTQEYKYRFVRGACGLFCSSNMKYNIGIHGSINGVPPQVNCLENKPTFECHPNVNQVFQAIMKLYLENG